MSDRTADRGPSSPPPAELASLRCWICWKAEREPHSGRTLKVPYYASGKRRSGRNGTSEDRSQMVDYETAVRAAAKHRLDGVGIAPTAELGLVILDFDDCVRDGEVDPAVLELIGDTYAELSPSGRGVHAIYRGHLGDRKSRADGEHWGFETFSTKGFVTFTGRTLEGWDLLELDKVVAPVNQRVEALYRQRFGMTDRARLDGAGPSGERLGVGTSEARLMLRRLDPDCGYDEWIQVGMGLHHEYGDEGFDLWDEWSSGGRKYGGTDDLASHWRSFGRHDGPPITLRTIAKRAGRLEAPASPDEFEDLTVARIEELQAAPEAVRREHRFAVHPAAEWAGVPAEEWWVKGVIPKAELVIVYGASGSGKSFWTLDVAASIARGEDWRGRRVRKGRVVYVAAEAARGMRKRLEAYARARCADWGGVDFGVVASAPNFLKLDDVVDLAAQVELAGGADLIVIDTLAQTMPGGNENASEDMGRVLAHAKTLHRMTGATIVIVHHSGKDQAKGARGWSGLKAAADAEIEITRDPSGARCALVDKLKDDADGSQMWFRLEVVEVGKDADGEPVTSCVTVDAQPPVGVGITRKLGEVQALVVQVVGEIAAFQSAGIEVDAVVAEVARRMPAPASPSVRDARTANARRALRSLCEGDDPLYRIADDDTIEIL